MLQAFVTTMREGIEAALAIAIVLSYLRRIGRDELSRFVYLGLWSALGISVVGAFIFHTLAKNEDAYEGYFMVVGGILVATLVAWMMKAARGLKGEIEGKLGEILSDQNPRAALAVFTFVFLMVGREGIETILMLSAVSLNTTALLSFSGSVLGLAAAVIFGVLFVRGSLRVNLKVFFRYTTAILFLVSVQLLISGLHELSEAKVLPSSTQEMALVGPIVNNSSLFFVAILALCAILFLLNRPPRPQPSQDQVGRAQWRLETAGYERQQRARTLGGLVALLLCVVLMIDFAHQRALAQPPNAENLGLSGSAVVIPIDSLRDGKLHLFRVPVQGKTVRFMAVRTSPGHVRTAFDVCGICEKTFFYQSGDNAMCSNCGASIFMPSIGESGGCNPIPLSSTLADTNLRIRVEDLKKEMDRF